MRHAEKIETKKILITRKELKEMGIPVSNSTLLRWEKVGYFPRRIRMSNTSVAWLLVEIEEWVTEKAEHRTI